MSYFLTEESAVKKKSEANQEIEWKKIVFYIGWSGSFPWGTEI